MCAAQTNLKSLRIQSKTHNKARLVFDVSTVPRYSVFQLQNPNRLVIDLENTQLTKKLKQPSKKQGLLSSLRTAVRDKKNLRIVINLQSKMLLNHFTLKANRKFSQRIVIDLLSKGKRSTPQKTIEKLKVVKTTVPSIRPFIVAIDAGHGGKDSGALGHKGTLEKNVVFEIAQKLVNLINQQADMEAILVRKGDYFIPLRERMMIARKAKADLFVSIHADAFVNEKATGASVFTLSPDGASREARKWLSLAKHENSVDLIGGVSLHDKGDTLASILLDLSQTASQDISQLIANDVLKNLSHIGELHSKTVQKAAFVVLKSPDIPSILVETAFISNPDEEKRLKSGKYQLKMAEAIHQGIASYAVKHKFALQVSMNNEATVHKIMSGETLLGIALQYGLTLNQLKRANTLGKGNKIRAGQVLSIPIGS